MRQRVEAVEEFRKLLSVADDLCRIAKECRDRERATGIESRDGTARDEPPFPMQERGLGD
jgi:hypothetical protein